MLDLRMGGNINMGSWVQVSARDDDDDDDDNKSGAHTQEGATREL